MPLSIKVNLRVTGHCNQGGRKYMEDMFSVAYQQTSDDKDLEYAFFGIFDGHGGGEAATFAKEHLMDIIVKQKNFWSDKDEDVLRAIRDGYVNTHYAMWRELDKWPRTASGLPSTAGTTASIAFIRKGKIYIGHVGDSAIILGYQDEGDPNWKARPLTKDHKPESVPEMTRIQESGGKVVSKSGVPRVVWNRPRIGHKGPVRRSTHIDEIPFLAVARSLGDLWSYNSELDTFVVSPEPDVKVVTVDVKSHRCLIFGTDGLWNMLTPEVAVSLVQRAERHNEKHFIASQQTGNGTDTQMWINPSKSLVDSALERWSSTRLRADNTSVVTLMLDPPGPSRGEVLLSRKKEKMSLPKSPQPQPQPRPCASVYPYIRDLYAGKPGPQPGQSQEPAAVPQTVDPTGDATEGIASDFKNDQPPQYPSCAHHTPPQVPGDTPEVSKAPEDPKASTESSELVEKTESSKDSNDVVQSSITVETPSVANEAPESPVGSPEVQKSSAENLKASESIQVAEVSSSDAATFQNGADDLEAKRTLEDSPEDSESEKPDSPSKDLEALSTQTPPLNQSRKLLNPSNNLQKLLMSTKSETFKITRQSDFSGSCDELKNGPRLRKSTQFGIQSIKEVSTTLTTRRRAHSTISEKRGTLLIARSAKRRTVVGNHSQMMPATSSSRLAGKKEAEVADCMRESVDLSVDPIREGSAKRRHSSTFEKEEEMFGVQEPCSKRRTRSEDRRCPGDENDPDNQGKQVPKQQSRVRWPACSIASKTRSSTPGTSYTSAGTKDSHQEKMSPGYQRRSLEKKATPVKTIRRPSINGVNRVQLRGSFALRDSLSPWDQSKGSRRSTYGERRSTSLGRGSGEPSSTPQMWLRSDTIAATPIKTLRSRNVDITGHTVPPQVAHQYGIVKQNRSVGSKVTNSGGKGKIKQGTSLGGGGSSGTVGGGVGGIAKRVKSVSPYNPSARSLNTRSRLKRLGK
ncbi:serine/arginine repetitive matrix protein 2 [Diachasma alloeum]|uniref:serine/arginine repetitive matrix protein 2 n=1 Tax=Diachasma alloeum TaxID=454923 RepID=UPI00073821D7|nr:serine/arginine repetitive matrix protein 2 [Diachasma alloeum]